MKALAAYLNGIAKVILARQASSTPSRHSGLTFSKKAMRGFEAIISFEISATPLFNLQAPAGNVINPVAGS
jgi:hypothetical protein